MSLQFVNNEFFAGSYKNARIGEVLASDADIGFNSEVGEWMVYVY